MTKTLRVNMMARQMTPFFSSSSVIHLHISFLFLKTFKIQFHGIPLLHYVPANDDTFKPVHTDILFLRKICQLLLYNIFCSQFDTNLAPILLTISPSRADPGRREKYNLNFCFYTSLWSLKRFYEDFKRLS